MNRDRRQSSEQGWSPYAPYGPDGFSEQGDPLQGMLQGFPQDFTQGYPQGSPPPVDTPPSGPLRHTTLQQMVGQANRRQFEEGGRKRRKKGRVASLINRIAILGLLCVLLALGGILNGYPNRVITGIIILFLGVSASWTQTQALTGSDGLDFVNDIKQGRFTGSTGFRYLLVAIGIAISFIGVFIGFSAWLTPSRLAIGIAAGLILITVLAIIIAPWWIGLISDLGKERAWAAQEELRADITTHLHDSVLQTLTLIQLNANDPQEVSALARSQERDLREWLYGDGLNSSVPASPGADGGPADSFFTSFASGASQPGGQKAPTISAELKRTIAAIEDSSRVPIDVVTVGDARYRPQFDSLIAAATEAAHNAVNHGRPPVSVYCEVDPQGTHTITVYVRDHGDGFDPQATYPGHLGVSESIVGRMKRAQGQAVITSRPGWGTEVALTLPFTA
ncbi:sensor histidine kinase [Parascardovia denticolens]|uniref:sensor histidine kinase n=1 Tax=Parascardovia denticolens TaxID=78258 RepID=UPI00248D8B6E|nr:ATP-binding protein [Parascardovia denticolens]